MNICIHCPMVFDPSKADQPATDERGGVFTGWALPDGEERPTTHEHEIATCAHRCGEPVDADDGMFCSNYCRQREIIECGD